MNNTISTCFRASSRSHCKISTAFATLKLQSRVCTAVHCTPVRHSWLLPKVAATFRSSRHSPAHATVQFVPKMHQTHWQLRCCTFLWTQHPAAIARPASHMRIAAGSRYANACWLSAAPGCCDCTEVVHEMPPVWWRTALMYAGSTAQQLAPLLHYLRGPGHKTLLLPPPVLGAGRG